MAELLGKLWKSPETRAVRNHKSGKINKHRNKCYYGDIWKSLVFEKWGFEGLSMQETGVKLVNFVGDQNNKKRALSVKISEQKTGKVEGKTK